MGSLRVVLADDHRLTAGAIADSLRARGFDVVGVAHSVKKAMALCVEKRPDVLVTDLDMGPGPSGVDLAIQAKRRMAQVGVVLLTAYEDPKLFNKRMPKVPSDVVYVLKHQVKQVSDVGAAVILAHQYAAGEVKPPRLNRRFRLTESQATLLRLVAKGLSNRAIAQELNLTEGSVATAINRLAGKFGLGASESTNVRVELAQKYFDLVGFQGDK